jgi:hypothetical protein
MTLRFLLKLKHFLLMPPPNKNAREIPLKGRNSQMTSVLYAQKNYPYLDIIIS